MKQVIAILLVLYIGGMALGQDTIDYENSTFLERIVIDGDTMLVAVIDEVYILPEKQFKNRREMRKYQRLIHNVKKVYPYAKIAGDFFDTVNVELANYDKDKEKKEYLKSVENQLLAEYEDDLKKLTISQGRILLKLIDRELAASPYDILKDYRGDFSAFFWQTIARIFGNNLKLRYDPEGEDRILHEIVLMIERGQI